MLQIPLLLIQHTLSCDLNICTLGVPNPTNTHPMVTRSKMGVSKPKAFTVSVPTEPKTKEEALARPEWLQAMKKEYGALIRNGTWSLVPLPKDRQPIGCKWIFKTKQNPDGSINKLKVRLVAKGFLQRECFGFTDTFSPIVKPTTIRIVLSIAMTKGLHLHQLDVNNVFLNGDLREDVYMVQPQGFEAPDKNLVCKLHKALYGLKKAPQAWFQKLTTTLHHMGFKSSRCDTSLFIKHSLVSTILILAYVDDIIVTGASKREIAAVVSQLGSTFALKDLGPLHYFLGVEVQKFPTGLLHLNQTKYATEVF